MPERKGLHSDLRVVSGGKSTDGDTPDSPALPGGVEKLVDRAGHYRCLLADHPDQEVLALVTDMVDAIEALGRLEQSTGKDAQQRAVEYRRLIAELEIEIVAALQTR